MMKALILALSLLAVVMLVHGRKLKTRSLSCIIESDSSRSTPQTSANATEVSQNTTCVIEFCEVCNKKGVCKQCLSGYYLKGQPSRCVPNCCPGHRLVNGKCRRNGCSSIRNCLKCPGFLFPSCIECKHGYYRYKHPLRFITKCVRCCPRGYHAAKGNSYHGPTCKRKKWKCPLMPGCIECPSMNKCYKCQQNMSIVEGIFISRCVKECPKYHHKKMQNNVNVCFPEEGCLDRFCIMCKRGWHKMIGIGKQCHKQCPIGHYVSTGLCLKCSWGCEQCRRPFSCDKCSDGLISLSSSLGIGDQCVFTCPGEYTKEFVNGTGYVCHQNCTVPDCANCASISFHGPHHCDFCKPGFHKLHIDSSDSCVKKCPAGYQRENGDFGGSVCRNDFVNEED